MYEFEKTILPEFPRTMHLPLEPNAGSDDRITPFGDMDLFLENAIIGQEKSHDIMADLRMIFSFSCNQEYNPQYLQELILLVYWPLQYNWHFCLGKH